MKKELLKGLTEEQIAKVKACKSTDEILAVAKNEGVELTEEQLEAVSGGVCTSCTCPKCGSNEAYSSWSVWDGSYFYCPKCEYRWDNEGNEVIPTKGIGGHKH